MARISVVLPCHNEEKNIEPIAREITNNIPKVYSFEIIFVDDGSTDTTPFVIHKLSSKDKNIKGIIFHRNFGHQMALLAGIEMAKGDAIITMDADFQHPPTLIPKIISLWEKNHDLVQLAKAKTKPKNPIKYWVRELGYQLWKTISGGIIIPGVSDFRLMDKKIAEFIIESDEREVFLRGVTNLAAANPITINYKVAKRKYGKSSYTLKMFLNMFINGFISFSVIPLRIASVAGVLLAIATSLFLAYDILSAILFGRKIIEGFLTVVLLILILNGFIIFYMGILGEYLGVIFREVKKRPKYLIQKTHNL